MARDVSHGYLQIEESQVNNLSWEFIVDDAPVAPWESAFGRWAYFSTMEVRCAVDLSLGEAHKSLGITEETSLGWVIVLRSSAMPKTVSSFPVEVVDGDQSIAITVAPGTVGGKLHAELLLLVLDSTESGANVFAPTVPGQVVFRTSTQIILEGSGSQLPILPVSFREQGFVHAQSANWWLRVNSNDLHSSSNSALWLWINTDNEALQVMLSAPESVEGSIWLKFLSIDFARQLLRIAIEHESFDTNEEYPEGSLGETLTSVVQLLGSSIDSVKAKYLDDPSRIETELQAIIGSIND